MKLTGLVCCLIGLAVPAAAQDTDSLRAVIAAAMRSATDSMRALAVNGGYVGIYSLTDTNERYGESFSESADPGEIWVQPPGTPSVGDIYLRAYFATGDSYYLDAARDVGRALAWGQRLEGGWDHLVDVTALTPDALMPTRVSGRCTFDDDITQGALRFLMGLDSVVDEPWLDSAVSLGIGYFMASQFSNGAWPQWYPLIGGYHDYYTFNDATINDCIAVMIRIHERYGNQEYLDRINLAGDFIIASQIAEPQRGWAQQYNHDMEPDWARAFEPPAVCSAVTSRTIRTLVDMALYTGDARCFAPIPAAIDWLNRSNIDDNLWARFYELGTNVPIYGDRDGLIHYTLEEISQERQDGYSWESSYGISSAIRYYEDVVAVGIDAYIADRDQPPTVLQLESQVSSTAGRASDALDALDAQYRWVNTDGWLYSGDFVNNLDRLCDFLEACNALDATAVTLPRRNRCGPGARDRTGPRSYELHGRRLGDGRGPTARGVSVVRLPDEPATMQLRVGGK